MFKAFDKLKSSLEKSRNNFVAKIKDIFSSNSEDYSSKIEDFESFLISNDIGARLAEKIISKNDLRNDTPEKIIDKIKASLISILNSSKSENLLSDNKPQIIVLIGVNGSGKTTSLGKLANYFKNLGKKVLLIPADTFRAASFDQLNLWAKKVNVEIYSQSNSTDPGAVIFQGLNFAKKNLFDVVLIDTAGRLQNKQNLMNELAKIKNVILKYSDTFEISNYLVLDANSGQNGIVQANEFNQYMKLDGLILTKLDGTAKGGIVFRIVDELNIPIKFLGIGEGVNDFQEFEIESFIESFFSNKTN